MLTMAMAGDCATVEGEQLVVSTPFTFATGKAELNDARAVLEVLCALEAVPDRTVQIEVHTDSQGSGSYNQRMSQARADAIREAIRRLGVAEGRVTSVGYGETMPMASNQTAEGRAQNRRIELHLAPPSSRPTPPAVPDTPAPAPVAAPERVNPPPKPPPPTLCEQLDQAIILQEARTWILAEPALASVAEAKQCVSFGWDVDDEPTSLYAYRAGWQLTVSEQGGLMVMELRAK